MLIFFPHSASRLRSEFAKWIAASKYCTVFWSNNSQRNCYTLYCYGMVWRWRPCNSDH